jgi:hypothetical protein
MNLITINSKRQPRIRNSRGLGAVVYYTGGQEDATAVTSFGPLSVPETPQIVNQEPLPWWFTNTATGAQAQPFSGSTPVSAPAQVTVSNTVTGELVTLSPEVQALYEYLGVATEERSIQERIASEAQRQLTAQGYQAMCSVQTNTGLNDTRYAAVCEVNGDPDIHDAGRILVPGGMNILNSELDRARAMFGPVVTPPPARSSSAGSASSAAPAAGSSPANSAGAGARATVSESATDVTDFFSNIPKPVLYGAAAMFAFFMLGGKR